MDRVGVDELLDEALVGGLGEPALLVEQGHNAHGLLDEVDGGLQVEAEVDKLPLDALALVLLLLQDEHGVVEELLQLLVGVVDAHLLERVELEDLEAGHVEDADEGGALALGPVQRAVDAVHQPAEHALVARLRNRLHRKLHLKETKKKRTKSAPHFQDATRLNDNAIPVFLVMENKTQQHFQ